MTNFVQLEDGVYGTNSTPVFLNYSIDKDSLLEKLGLTEFPDTLYILTPYETGYSIILLEEPEKISSWDGGFNYGTCAYITLPEKQYKHILIGAEND